MNGLEARKQKIPHVDDVIMKERKETVTPLRTLDIYSGAGKFFEIVIPRLFEDLNVVVILSVVFLCIEMIYKYRGAKECFLI